MSKPNLRSQTVGSWPSKGQTPDHGAGSGAKGLLSNMTETQVQSVAELHGDIVDLIKGRSRDVQVAAALSAVSIFTFEAIESKAAEKPTIVALPKVNKEAQDRAVADLGDKPHTAAQFMDCFNKFVDIIKSERKAVREDASDRKSERDALAAMASEGMID